MCSDSQPKMFLNPMSIGSGGQFSTPVQYPSNPQPTAAAPGVSPPIPAPAAPATPSATTPTNPAKPKIGGGTKVGTSLLESMMRRSQ